MAPARTIDLRMAVATASDVPCAKYPARAGEHAQALKTTTAAVAISNTPIVHGFQ
jgi:hypothetical protein